MINSFAYLVFYASPVVFLAIFYWFPLRKALILTLLLGYLFLPEWIGINLPAVPTIDKRVLPALFAVGLCFTFLALERKKERLSLPGFQRDEFDATNSFKPVRANLLFWGLVLLLFASPFVTAMTNTEMVARGLNDSIRALRLYDAFSMNGALVMAVIPFFLGRRFLWSPESHRLLLRILAIVVFGYCFLALYEIRMSPQLNRIIYGFFPHNWSQHVRGDGFRPLVFLNHALWLSIVIAMGALAALSLSTSEKVHDTKVKWGALFGFMFLVLFLTKSLGAFVLCIMGAGILLLCGNHMRMLWVTFFAATVLLYPMLRGADLVPVNGIVAMAEAIDPRRAGSLQFRLDNEDVLLDRAREKPLAGWGGWQRSRVFGDAGRDLTTTDGYWVIVIGVYGWLGYIAQFGLLALPLCLYGLARSRIEISSHTSGLAVLLCIALIDLLPNATISPIVWLIAGAILGSFQTAPAVQRQKPLLRTAQASGIGPTEDAAPDLPAVARDIEAKRPLHKRRPRTGMQEN